MFIVAGKKAVYTKQGYVADFCPLCRSPQVFLVRRVGMAGHLYHITVSQGDLVGFERSCEGCGTVFETDPRRYSAIAKEHAPLGMLRSATFPDLAEVLAERLELEDRLRHSPGQLSAEERRALLREPFGVLAPKVEAHFAETRMDKEVGHALLGTIALAWAGAWLAPKVLPDDWGTVVLGLIAVGMVGIIWQIVGCGRRYMRREVLPLLAKTLRPLRASSAELAAVIAELKQAKLKIGQKLHLRDLEAASQALLPGQVAARGSEL